jgi:transcription elongation factor GreB
MTGAYSILLSGFDDLKVVNHAPFHKGKVLFGAWAEIKNDKGEQ